MKREDWGIYRNFPRENYVLGCRIVSTSPDVVKDAAKESVFLKFVCILIPPLNPNISAFVESFIPSPLTAFSPKLKPFIYGTTASTP